MSEDSEHQFDDSDFGLSGNEKRAGFEPLVPASPVDIPAEPHMTPDELAYAKRGPEADWGPEPVERDYVNNQTGEATPSNQVVGERQAAADLAAVRAAEADARKQQGDRDLADALDQLNARDQGQQPPAQDQQPQDPTALYEPQPDAPQMTAEEAQALYEQSDKELETALQNPLLRAKLETEFEAVRAASKQEVERAHNLSAAAQQHYATAINDSIAQVNGVLAALAPELQGLNSPQEVAAAMRVMAQQNPQRVQALQQLASRAAGLVEAQQRQQSQAAEFQQRQATEAFQKYAAEQDARAFSKTPPEELTKIRNFLYADAEKAGISRTQLEQTWNNNPALRNAFTSELVADGVRWRMAQRGLSRHRANPIPQVQRPGVASDGPSDNNEYASLERQFRGRDLSAKQAADLLIAHRARR